MNPDCNCIDPDFPDEISPACKEITPSYCVKWLTDIINGHPTITPNTRLNEIILYILSLFNGMTNLVLLSVAQLRNTIAPTVTTLYLVTTNGQQAFLICYDPD